MNDLPLIRSSSKLPQLRLINAVVVLLRVAARYGIGVERLLEGSGITSDDLNDPQKLITIRQELTVTRSLGTLVPEVPWIGLEVGKDYHFSANGKLGLAMMCCETLMDSLTLAMNYIHLTNSYHQYSLYVRDGMGYGEFRELMDLGEIRRAVCEAEVSSLHCMAKLGHGGEGVFKEIRFDYPRPPYSEKYEELFQCNVVFDAPCHTLVFDADNLEKPLKLANPLVRHAMEQECRRMLPLLKQHESMTHRIHQELSAQKEGFATLDQLARRISLSPRTLRRRLVDEGTSYNSILAEVRQGRAMELLTTTRLSMENVASHLGFSEVSSFYRAFKSWTGSTPSRFREKHVL